MTGSNPSKDANDLKRKFDGHEHKLLAGLPSGGKRHTALAESLPKIKDGFLKDGHRYVVDKFNERSRSVLDNGLQRIAKDSQGAANEEELFSHDNRARRLIDKYVRSEARFYEQDGDAMFGKYLEYSGSRKEPVKPKAQTMEYDYERDGGDHRTNLLDKEGSEAGLERHAAAADADEKGESGDSEEPQVPADKSSAQHAREMEEKAEDDHNSGKLAGVDNDAHHKKSAGADKDVKTRNWTPEERVKFARGYVGSKAYNKDKNKDDFEKGSPKCNKFVYDMLTKSGAKIPLIGGVLNGNPPRAMDWAKADTDIEGFEIVGTPQPGDVVSDGKHVGIVSGKGKTISAASEANEVIENDWGFRPHQQGKMHFRRYVGE